ncbi:MAG: twin-arginine translocase TatA/TatE family subunit [Alphaproteobacteria bacterium]|nr:twin-arginine translocase TatA/TatE family subunit [Alphaproteobacteria bacterium]
MGLSIPHLILLIVVILLLFGANKVPGIMENLARGVKSFKKGLKEDESQNLRISEAQKDKE